MEKVTKEVKEVEKRVKLELETIYKDREKFDINLLTKMLGIPLRDVKNILGVEK